MLFCCSTWNRTDSLTGVYCYKTRCCYIIELCSILNTFHLHSSIPQPLPHWLPPLPPSDQSLVLYVYSIALSAQGKNKTSTILSPHVNSGSTVTVPPSPPSVHISPATAPIDFLTPSVSS